MGEDPDFQLKKFENLGDCHTSVRAGKAMTGCFLTASLNYAYILLLSHFNSMQGHMADV